MVFASEQSGHQSTSLMFHQTGFHPTLLLPELPHGATGLTYYCWWTQANNISWNVTTWAQEFKQIFVSLEISSSFGTLQNLKSLQTLVKYTLLIHLYKYLYTFTGTPFQQSIKKSVLSSFYRCLHISLLVAWL